MPDYSHSLTANNSGQTILEVLIALIIIILFLSGIIVIQLLSLKNSQYSQAKNQASEYANEQLERAKIIRDTSGLSSLDICLTGCYINNELTPIPISPTGVYGQNLTIRATDSSDELCKPEDISDPVPTVYLVEVEVSWGDVSVVPAPKVNLSKCLSNWR
jgi:type II secretory pathway pseudopilin PulG